MFESPELTLCHKTERVTIFKIPPLSTTKGHYLDDWKDPAGNQIVSIIQYTNTFNSETDAYFTFFDITGVKSCYESGTNSYDRVIIVATNIAEASITIKTLKYVVDTGIEKTNIFDYEKGSSTQQMPKPLKTNKNFALFSKASIRH